VIARNYRGDSISWQFCHDVSVVDCESRGHTGLGLHPGSAAVDVQGTTAGLTFRRNVLRETRAAGRRVGFRIGKDTKDITLDGNTVEGFARGRGPALVPNDGDHLDLDQPVGHDQRRDADE
jgi:hypothetical protein